MERLEGVVQHYAWGDPDVIPELLGRPGDGTPCAEYWMGDHPRGTAVVAGATLDAHIAADPVATLGRDIADQYGQMPFLFKVLAARQPLSIQTHPSLAEAEAGFDREEGQGLPIDSPARVYRDRNHKPELICAVTEFEALCGFRPVDEIRARLTEIGGLDALDDQLDRGLRDAVAWLLTRRPEDHGDLIQAACADPVVAEAARHHPGDLGLVLMLFMNHVVLAPGDALFLTAGNLHAYLRGTGMELMANSDNVVRGGLTPKHVDVPELLRVTRFEPGAPPVQRPIGPVHTFESPIPEFALTRIAASPPGPLVVDGPEIVFQSEGRSTLRTTDGVALTLDTGQAAFLDANDREFAMEVDGLAWRATRGRIEV